MRKESYKKKSDKTNKRFHSNKTVIKAEWLSETMDDDNDDGTVDVTEI